MNIPVNKNRSWMACVYRGIENLDENTKAAIIRPAGQACANDIVMLCEKYLGRAMNAVDDLVSGWNILRERRGLTGLWEIEGNVIRGVFGECGCPLVRSGLIEHVVLRALDFGLGSCWVRLIDRQIRHRVEPAGRRLQPAQRYG